MRICRIIHRSEGCVAFQRVRCQWFNIRSVYALDPEAAEAFVAAVAEAVERKEGGKQLFHHVGERFVLIVDADSFSAGYKNCHAHAVVVKDAFNPAFDFFAHPRVRANVKTIHAHCGKKEGVNMCIFPIRFDIRFAISQGISSLIAGIAVRHVPFCPERHAVAERDVSFVFIVVIVACVNPRVLDNIDALFFQPCPDEAVKRGLDLGGSQTRAVLLPLKMQQRGVLCQLCPNDVAHCCHSSPSSDSLRI